MDDHNPLPYATNTIVALKIFYQPYDLTFANKAFFFFYFFASISKYHNLFNWSNNRSWVLIIIFLIMCSYSRGSYPMELLSNGSYPSLITHLWWSSITQSILIQLSDLYPSLITHQFLLHQFLLHQFLLHQFLLHQFLVHQFLLHQFLLHQFLIQGYKVLLSLFRQRSIIKPLQATKYC